MAGVVRFLISGILFSLMSLGILGQDLGSSNNLFRNKKAASTPAKSASSKRKTTPAKPRNSVKTTTVASKSTKKGRNSTPTVKKPEPESVAALPKKSTVIAVKPPAIAIPSSPAIDEQFEKLIVDGNTARDDRNYAAAESAYNRAKNLKPKDSRAIYGLGNLYSDQQRWEDAEISYRAALKLDPANAIVNVALSYVLSQPIIVPNLSDRYDEAELFARRAIELAPSNALAFDQLGVAMELRGLISEETENAYRNAIRLDPSFTPAYAHLGRLLRRQGNLKESAAAYDNAVKRSNDVPTLILVADVMQSEQRYAESEPLLRKAVENDPKNPTGLLLLGKALTTLGNFADAEKFLLRSLTVSPNGFMPNCLLGSLYARQGKYELAENALLQALRFVSPNEKRNLSIQFEMVGDGYMKTGNASNAERAFKQAITLDAERGSLAAKLAKSQQK